MHELAQVLETVMELLHLLHLVRLRLGFHESHCAFTTPALTGTVQDTRHVLRLDSCTGGEQRSQCENHASSCNRAFS